MPGTDGNERVRKDFNPSANPDVAELKTKSAELIDLCEKFKNSGEQARCAALAQTNYEQAAMWAVKAATYKS